MNILEQLVRVLTNAYSRSQRMFGERVSPGPANRRSFHGLSCCWGQMLIKRQPLIHLSDYALSLSLSACFLRTRFMMSSQGQETALKRRGLIACVLKWATQTANFWAQIILDSYRRPLTLTFLLVSTRGLFQDTMFDRLQKQHVIRGYFRSFSETASQRHREGNLCGSCGRKTYPETV